MIKDAEYWNLTTNGSIKCELCPLFCVIESGKSGVCRYRSNINNKLFLTNYGSVVEFVEERVEKKPLFHYYPGSKVLSIGSNGCNMSCTFCQNFEISQYEQKTTEYTEDKLLKVISNSAAIGICFTFNEPLVWFEFVRDTAKKVKDLGKKVILNTNGLINPKPLKELLPLIDAVNIDIKGFSDSFYKTICGSPIQPVLDSAKTIIEYGIHTEISHLVIEGSNDRESLPLGKWIIDNLGNIPIHLNKFYPRYLLTSKPTNDAILLRLYYEYKTLGFSDVYIGNAITDVGKNTLCKCGFITIDRSDYINIKINTNLNTNTISSHTCPSCNTPLTLKL